MAEQIIRDPRGVIIARIAIDSNGDKTIRDSVGRVLGRYRASSDVTYDPLGRVVARGDCLTMLIVK